LAISIRPALGLFEKRIYFGKNEFCEICKIYIEKLILASSKRIAFWSVLSVLPWVFLKNAYFFKKTYGGKRFGVHESHLRQ